MMILDRAKYGRVNRWAGWNDNNKDCIWIIKNTEAPVSYSG
jgi:hypothetical protein